MCFVSFFPQLVAGQIEKARDLLPQFKKKKTFNQQSISDGLRQMLWGFFQKIVIADNCSSFVNYIFDSYETFNGATLFFGLFLFSIQIYCDFAGYSHIGIGVAKLFGYELKQNFAYPYFSRNFYEFWRRWHISLTNWFKTYVYFPLGGNKKNLFFTIRNIWIVFLLSGLWHGAGWNFIVWGVLHALLYMPFVFNSNKTKYKDEIISLDSPTLIKEFMGVCLTNILLCFTWLFFRSKDLDTAINYLKLIFLKFADGKIQLPELQISPLLMLLLIIVFLFIEWQTKTKKYPLEDLQIKYPMYKRYGLYYLIIGTIFLYGARSQEFLYFQF